MCYFQAGPTLSSKHCSPVVLLTQLQNPKSHLNLITISLTWTCTGWSNVAIKALLSIVLLLFLPIIAGCVREEKELYKLC